MVVRAIIDQEETENSVKKSSVYDFAFIFNVFFFTHFFLSSFVIVVMFLPLYFLQVLYRR